MKNKPLKHYKQKKFFYRLFMRKSPLAGAMFGLAWMSMVVGLSPFVLYAILSLFGEFKYGWMILLLAAPFYIYGFLLCAFGISRIYKNIIKYKKISSGAGFLGAWYLVLLGIVLLPVLIRKKKFAGVGLAIAGTVFYVLSYFRYFNILQSVLLGTFCYLAALAFLKDECRFSWKFTIPLGIAVFSHLFFIGYYIYLEHDVKAYRDKLSQTIGRSVEISDFWHRNAQGFPVDREPMKSWITGKPESAYEEFEYKNAEIAKKKLLEYNRKYPAFVKSIHDFLQLPVSHASHQVPENGMLYSVMMPELSTFRESARYLAMKIAAAPGNKQLVYEHNQNLLKLRNWSLENDDLLSCIVAIAIESIRLNALEAVLRTGNFSRQEIIGLIGDPVDWEKYLHYAYGAEATAFKSALDHLQKAYFPFQEKKIFNTVKKYMPLFLRVHFLRDYRFALQSYIKVVTVPASLSGLEKAKLAEIDDNEPQRKFYMLSGMLLPTLEHLYINIARIDDGRQMALIAAGVMEYRKQHGKLPEDLSFLPEVPLSKLDHKPLMYEKTKEGFRIFSNTDKGVKPTEKDTRHSYRVQLL